MQLSLLGIAPCGRDQFTRYYDPSPSSKDMKHEYLVRKILTFNFIRMNRQLLDYPDFVQVEAQFRRVIRSLINGETLTSRARAPSIFKRC